MNTGMGQNNGDAGEVVLREHRRWARWIKGRRPLGEGNLTLTNRRVIFLHRIQSSPVVETSIKRMADAPMKDVLDYAFTLNKSNFQIPLTSIVKVGIGTFIRFPLPHFYLYILYTQGKKKLPGTVAFQFRRPILQVIIRPHIIEVWKWRRAIKQAIKETGASN